MKSALLKMNQIYGSVVKAGIYNAPSIKVAEVTKVIENTQRDLNIAFMNELVKIFDALNINTHEVLMLQLQNGIFCHFNQDLLVDIVLVLIPII